MRCGACFLELREGHAAVCGRTCVDTVQPSGRPFRCSGTVREVFGRKSIAELPRRVTAACETLAAVTCGKVAHLSAFLGGIDARPASSPRQDCQISFFLIKALIKVIFTWKPQECEQVALIFPNSVKT